MQLTLYIFFFMQRMAKYSMCSNRKNTKEMFKRSSLQLIEFISLKRLPNLKYDAHCFCFAYYILLASARVQSLLRLNAFKNTSLAIFNLFSLLTAKFLFFANVSLAPFKTDFCRCTNVIKFVSRTKREYDLGVRYFTIF